jgi:hypothetical protein
MGEELEVERFESVPKALSLAGWLYFWILVGLQKLEITAGRGGDFE